MDLMLDEVYGIGSPILLSWKNRRVAGGWGGWEFMGVITWLKEY